MPRPEEALLDGWHWRGSEFGMMDQRIKQMVAGYYSDRLQHYGATAQGVDWNSSESQELRFTQLLKVVEGASEFSLNDIGCGYGALLDYLGRIGIACAYTGYDLSPDMIRSARERHGNHPAARFIEGDHLESAEFGIASGIFNVRLDTPVEVWERHVLETLDSVNETSGRGFAFNILTRYSDPSRMRPDLYYADPCRFFNHCKRAYSPHIALLHDYGLFEFTILVRKSL